MDTPEARDFSTVALDKISELATDTVQAVEASARRAPLKAIGVAVGAGYLLRHLPIFPLLGVFFRLLLILLRPVALLVAAVKLYQLLVEAQTFKPSE